MVLLLENNEDRTVRIKCYLPTVEIKNYNVMINGPNVSDQPVNNNLITYENIRKIATGAGDDYMTFCLLDYNCFNNYYKIIALDSSKPEALHTDPKAIQQINFTENLNWGENINDNTIMFFIIVEAKGTILDFSQGIVKVL